MHFPFLVANRRKLGALALSLMLLSGCRATTYDDALNFRHHGDQTLYRAALRSAANSGDVQAMVVLAGELAATLPIRLGHSPTTFRVRPVTRI